jgi:hypothetical protein
MVFFHVEVGSFDAGMAEIKVSFAFNPFSGPREMCGEKGFFTFEKKGVFSIYRKSCLSSHGLNRGMRDSFARYPLQGDC